MYEDECCLSSSDSNICTSPLFEFNVITELESEYKSDVDNIFYGIAGFGYNSNASEINANLMGAINADNSAVQEVVTWMLVEEANGAAEVYIGEGAGSGYKGKAIDVGPTNCTGWSVPVTGVGYGGLNVYQAPGLISCGLLQTEYPFIGVSAETNTAIREIIDQFNYTFARAQDYGDFTYVVNNSCQSLVSVLPDI